MGVTRREVLKSSLGALGVFAATSPLARAMDAACRQTAGQTEGPFYPIKDQPDKDRDLTFVRGHSRVALGQVVFIRGRVLGSDCTPVSGARVEIWQACASGKYNHPDDVNPAPLDPDFQYWGRAVAGDDGGYAFKTILPGSYPNDPTWTRPPHIHFKVHAVGFRELTTQLYFAGNPLNDSDRILQALSPAERESVVVRLTPSQFEPRALDCDFDLVLP